MSRGRPKGSKNKPKASAITARITRLLGNRYRVLAEIDDIKGQQHVCVKPDNWKVGTKMIVEKTETKIEGCNWVCISKPGKVK